MARSNISAARDRAYARMIADFPGTISISGGTALACAVVIGIEERETVDGGFSRVRSATIFISKTTLATLPDLQARAEVVVTPTDAQAETMRLFEQHDQSENHWLLRCGQFQ